MSLGQVAGVEHAGSLGVVIGESAGRVIGDPITLSTDRITMTDDDKPDLKIPPFDEVSWPATRVGLAILMLSVTQARLSEDDKEIILFQWLASTQRSLEDATPVSPGSLSATT